MKTEDTLYKQLHEKQLTRHDLMEVTWAIKELAESIGSHNAWDALRYTTNALRYINEFRGNLVPTIDLGEADANIAIGLHTYMRKGMDCPLGTMLYQLIAESRGTNVWYAFVKGVGTGKATYKDAKRVFQHAIHEAEGIYRTANDSTDDLFMLSALRMWEEDFPNALEYFK